MWSSGRGPAALFLAVGCAVTEREGDPPPLAQHGDIVGRWVTRETLADLVFLSSGRYFGTRTSSHLQRGEGCGDLERREAGIWKFQASHLYLQVSVSDLLVADIGQLRIMPDGTVACDEDIRLHGVQPIDTHLAVLGPLDVSPCAASPLGWCMSYGGETYVKLLGADELPATWHTAAESLHTFFPAAVRPMSGLSELEATP